MPLFCYCEKFVSQFSSVPRILELLKPDSFGGVSCTLPSFFWMLKVIQDNCPDVPSPGRRRRRSARSQRTAACCGHVSTLIWESTEDTLGEDAILAEHTALIGVCVCQWPSRAFKDIFKNPFVFSFPIIEPEVPMKT